MRKEHRVLTVLTFLLSTLSSTSAVAFFFKTPAQKLMNREKCIYAMKYEVVVRDGRISQAGRPIVIGKLTVIGKNQVEWQRLSSEDGNIRPRILEVSEDDDLIFADLKSDNKTIMNLLTCGK